MGGEAFIYISISKRQEKSLLTWRYVNHKDMEEIFICIRVLTCVSRERLLTLHTCLYIYSWGIYVSINIHKEGGVFT